MWYEADIDALMTRTANRPIPRGRVTPAGSAGLRRDAGVLLGDDARHPASTGSPAALLAFTIFFYVVIYTMWLKRWTAQNIVIGGAAGALPPVVGWAAATGSLSVEPLLLFLIIFFWTPPHFWALALFRSDDYARAGVPMLPVVAGPDAHAAADPALHHRAGRGRRSRRGRSAISTRSMASPRWCSAPACWRSPINVYRHRERQRRRCARRASCSPSRSCICSRCSRPCCSRSSCTRLVPLIW